MKASKVLVLAAAFILAATAAFGAEYQFKVASTMSSNFPPQKALEEFVNYLNKESGGRIKAQRYADGQLGSTLEVMEAIQMGVVQMAMPVTSDLAGYSKKIQVLDLPFLFKDFTSMRKALSGPLGKEMDKIYDAQGFKCFGYVPNGTRHITNNKRAIFKPDDLKGIKIRVMQNPMHIAIFKMLGANPTPLSYSELYTALQQGVVDGQENAPAQVVDAKLHEVQKYYSLTGHLQSMICLMVSKKWYNSLPNDLKKIFDKGIAQYEKHYVKLYFDYDNACLDIMKKAGVKINNLTDAQHKAFKDKVAPIYDQYKNEIGKDLIDLAVNASK